MTSTPTTLRTTDPYRFPHFQHNQKGTTVASLDKLSGEAVKELEANAEHYTNWQDFEDDVRLWAGNVWNGEPNSLSSGTYEEFKTLGTQYDDVVSFQNEMARYAELAWGHARQAADPGPQPNAHLTGTAAGGDVPPGDAGSPLWVGPGEHGETVQESGVVTTGPLDEDKGSLTASTPAPLGDTGAENTRNWD